MFLNICIHQVKDTWACSSLARCPCDTYISDSNLPTVITVIFFSPSTNVSFLHIVYTRAVCTFPYTSLHTSVKHSLSIPQSLIHPLNLFYPPFLTPTDTHTLATAVFFHLIPLSSHVITALNPGPQRRGLAHAVFLQTAASGLVDVTPKVSCLGSRTHWRIKKELPYITC